MTAEYFSRKYGLRPTPDGLIYEDVPIEARTGLFQIMTISVKINIGYQNEFLNLYQAICKMLRKPWNWNITEDFGAAQATESLIMDCKWWEFYDICQFFWQYLDYKYKLKSEREKLTAYEYQINYLFRDEFLGFELHDGEIERTGNPITDAKIKEARILLKEPEFKSADELFEKAIKAFNERPNPDVENCIKDAVAAIESIGKIISNNEKAKLDDIINNAVKKGVIPQPLDQTITKLHAYRGNEPAVAHGGIEPSKVTIDEAEFVLAMSAAMILYLVKKRSVF